MQLNKTMYIDLVDPLPKITHLRMVSKAIAIDQMTAQCVTYMLFCSTKEKVLVLPWSFFLNLIGNTQKLLSHFLLLFEKIKYCLIISRAVGAKYPLIWCPVYCPGNVQSRKLMKFSRYSENIDLNAWTVSLS